MPIRDTDIISFQSPKSLFVVEPRTLELQPEQSAALNVSVYLSNPVKIVDKLNIVVENGTNTACILKATGVGTSILCEPKIYPELNIGTFLTHQRFSQVVKLTNKGYKTHKILWSRNKNLKQLKENPDIIIPYVIFIALYFEISIINYL